MSYNKKSGKYTCAACGNGLFNSKTKYDSDCGWPSFYKSKNNSVLLKKDFSYGINRTEIICKRCGSHLGHIFDDGPKPTGKRFCINSVALKFREDKSDKKQD